jgi:hypothetical protein
MAKKAARNTFYLLLPTLEYRDKMWRYLFYVQTHETDNRLQENSIYLDCLQRLLSTWAACMRAPKVEGLFGSRRLKLNCRRTRCREPVHGSSQHTCRQQLSRCCRSRYFVRQGCSIDKRIWSSRRPSFKSSTCALFNKRSLRRCASSWKQLVWAPLP